MPEQLDVYENLPEESVEKISEAVSSCCDSMLRISAERDLIKETLKSLSKEVAVDKKILSKLVKTAYKKNFDEEVVVQEQFESLYNKIAPNA